MKRLCLLILICLNFQFLLGAQGSTLLQGEFWAEYEAFKDGELQNSQTPLVLTKAILGEAQYFFSGMIYGFDFSYTPLDRARAIDEKFELSPRGTIDNGDPKLRYLESRRDASNLYIRLIFELGSIEAQYLNQWRSPQTASAQGRSSASMLEPSPRYLAFKEACKEAIRSYARSITRNKPDEIRGSFALSQVPQIWIQSGQFWCNVRLVLRIDTIDAYRTW